MASLSHDGQPDRWRVLVVLPNGKRKTIRLGQVPKSEADTVKGHIESLAAALTGRFVLPGITVSWVSRLQGALRKRLERAGLIEPLEPDEPVEEPVGCPTLTQWVQTYIDGRKDVKEATATVYGHTQRNLRAYFGDSKRLDEIMPGDADDFRIFLKSDEGLSDNTVRRRMGIAKQFFGGAVRKRIIPQDPFDGQATIIRENRKRSYFVSHEESQAVLDACPSVQWRLVFALARYGGLRCSSEVARLKWAEVDWERMRFTVHASKTEHHADSGIRQVPIFPELHPYLRDAFEEAEPGAIYCCPQYKNANQLYRKHVKAMVEKAGLTVWPKLFQNCRSTRETELCEEFPVHVVCAWIGNSPAVAAKHYLQVTNEHFERAAHESAHESAHKAAQQGSAVGRTGSHAENAESGDDSSCTGIQTDAAPCDNREPQLVGDTGLEPVTSSL
jgi:integrase